MNARADNAEIQQAKDGGIALVILKGNPARLKQTMDDGQQMDAEALTIRYDVAAGKVTLEGGALVNRGADRIQGQQITYHPDTGMMAADGGSSGPVIFTLQPTTARPAAPAAAEPKPADGGR